MAVWNASLMKRIKELQYENCRLKKMVAKERLVGAIAREALEKIDMAHHGSVTIR